MTLISFIISLLTLLPMQSLPYSVAHRGCHIKGYIPENSPDGVAMAKRYGFRAIECDVHYTRDNQLIIMHDRTINRTMVNASDLSPIAQPVEYAKTDLAELRSKYVLASSDPAKRRPIPTFAEELEACKKYGIIPMMHTPHFEAYKMAKKVLGDNFIAFCGQYDSLKQVRTLSKNCLILWDPDMAPADEVVRKLKELGGPCGVTSMRDYLLTADYIQTVRDAGFEVQSSIFKTPLEVESIAKGATYVLSDFCLFPFKPVKTVKKLAASARSLQAGERLTFTGKKLQYGSLELSIDVKGDVEVIVNGKRHYQFKDAQSLKRLGSWRFYDRQPTVEIIANTASVVNQLDIKEYKY